MAIAGLALTFVAYLAYGWAALVRIGALDDSTRLVAGCAALAALWVAAWKQPLAIGYLLLAVLPLFGNHPGGRFMEFVNLPLAATAAGLIGVAHREHRLAPTGTIWRIASLYLLTAIVALIPTIPGVAIRAAQINDPPLLVAEALTAAEDNPLYSISSIMLLILVVVWAFALSWAAVANRFLLRAYWVLTVALFVVTLVGVSDYSGLTSVGPSYVRFIDARAAHFVGLQSIFWDPGWFAWYFVMTFAIALGLWTIEGGYRGRFLGCGILLCYLSSFLNAQKAVLIAVHVTLFLFAWHLIRTSVEPRRARRRIVAVVVPVLILIAGLASVPAGRAAVARGHLLSLERSINAVSDVLRRPDAGNRRPSERERLWKTALMMWRDAPAFGIGEGSFAWRFREYVPAGSVLDTLSRGDAHSLWFQLLATRGAVGVAIFALLVFAVVRALWVRWHDPAAGPAVTGLILALVGFLMYSFVSALFYLQPIQLIFWLIVARAIAPASAQGQTSGWFKWAVAAACPLAVVVQLVVARPFFAAASSTLVRQPRGFYPIELGPQGTAMRWSSASGVLCLRPDATRVRLRFAIVDPRVATLPRRVTLRLNGREVDVFDLTTVDVVTRVVELGATDSRPGPVVPFGECTSTSRRLLVSVNRTWSPADTGFGRDPRRLGVLVFEPTHESSGVEGT